jgi:hypothetical protein
MRYASRLLATTLIALGLASHGLVAGDIPVDSTDFGKLPADQQKKLVSELQGKGLLSGDDKVVYSGPEISERRAPPALLLTLGPLACRAVVAAKKREDLAACLASATPAADGATTAGTEGGAGGTAGSADAADAGATASAAGCEAQVAGRYSTIETVCNAIRLF